MEWKIFLRKFISLHFLVSGQRGKRIVVFCNFISFVVKYICVKTGEQD